MSKGPEGSWSSECVGTGEVLGRNQPMTFKAELAQVGVAGTERSTGTMKNHKGFRLQIATVGECICDQIFVLEGSS